MPVTPMMPPAQVTFVLHDAGETKAMQPVMQDLANKGVQYDIIADGTAEKLIGYHPPTEHALNAPVILTGVVSKFQRDWAAFFKQQSKTVVGYYDGLLVDNNAGPVAMFKGVLSHLLTTTTHMANSFKPYFSDIQVKAVGQPALEASTAKAASIDKLAVAKQLGVDSTKPTLLFIGGYGDGYQEAFAAFCQAVKPLTGVNVLVATHPKTTGQLEKQWIDSMGLQGLVSVLPQSVPSSTALAISDMVLSHKSTMVFEGLLQGKQAAFVGSAPSLNSAAVNQQALKRYQTAGQLNQAVNQLVASHGGESQQVTNNNQAATFWALSLPQQATQRISNFLQSILDGKASLSAEVA